MEKINGDKYFMSLAKISELRSKDPNTQVGACIVNKSKRVVALGYNGMPHGNDKDFPGDAKAENAIDTKYPYVIHAEMNALLNANASIENSTIYVTLFPCSNCAKSLGQAGIKELVYTSDKYANTEDNIISKKILKTLGIKMRQIDDFIIDIK